MQFEPGRFSDVMNTKLGQDLLAFLGEHDTFVRLETATQLGHPAVDGIAEQLLARFGDVVRADRLKQFVGFATRQVMENNGYDFLGSNFKSRSEAGLFTKGSRYERAKGASAPVATA